MSHFRCHSVRLLLTVDLNIRSKSTLAQAIDCGKLVEIQEQSTPKIKNDFEGEFGHP
jgi:hypothetical protein